MQIKITNELQLKQSLKLTHAMIQRFQVLQQSVQEFEQLIQDMAETNPFIEVHRNLHVPYAGDSDLNLGEIAIDYVSYEESMVSHLTRQLDVQFLSEKDTDIVLILIDHLDSQGFLSDYKTVRASIVQDFNVDERHVFKCLKILQSFEPDGVGARSLNECLWNQIDHYGLDDTEDEDHLKTIVKHHLDDISSQNHDAIMTALGINKDRLDRYLEFISHLNPTPAAIFRTKSAMVIQPSLKVVITDGDIEIINLEEQRMSVHLNEQIIAQLDTGMDDVTQKKLADAKLWIEHYKKRQALLKNCGDYLIKKQRLFFTEGPEYILPCLQKDLAKNLQVSQSTISRLVRTKYIEFDGSLVLFKNLCQRHIYGKTIPQVKRLITYYCQKYPRLSDRKLADILKDIGLPIARRTVAKYRHEANQLSSYSRKNDVLPKNATHDDDLVNDASSSMHLKLLNPEDG
ncbi:MAG: hypothetical protein ACO3K7_03085 [Candidatus Marinamargulisbacteria bacterium]